MKLAGIRSTVAEILFNPPLLALSERLPVLRNHCRGWRRTHPFDREFGVETSGFLSVDTLHPGSTPEEMSPYAGSVPSVLRRSLQTLPSPDQYIFVDLGCGKARSSVVASEFPFRQIIGVELSERLAAVARTNADTIARRFPQRTRIEVAVGDAAVHPLSSEQKRRVVYFLCNSFPPAVLRKFTDHVAHELRHGMEHAFLVYYNPVEHEVVDGSRVFARWSAETIAVDAAERGFGPDEEDTVVIWQTLPSSFEPRPGASRRIIVPGGTNHAGLAD